ncbi:uncharacterized protein IL334_005349 [Kwoniella shivajii]|uniref:Uncharacterized protein n=1 Tax=Kwoniella shivajii TaxID=564305 RepID=A0ABZ1D369_9TREE|nr:hypothetical protein IL334_005349 [Kwoniella shivajii]
MGLLSIFKSSPSSSSSSKQTIHNSTTTTKSNVLSPSNQIQPDRPFTPNPKLAPYPPNSDHDFTPTSSKLSRPTIPPPSPSTSSISSRIKPWKKDKDKSKSKKKEIAHEDSIGTPYESNSTSPPTKSGSLPDTPKINRKSTFDIPVPNSSSPLINSISLRDDHGLSEHLIDEDRSDHGRSDSGKTRKDRVTSGQFRQVGGILGQLNFEVSNTLATSPSKQVLPDKPEELISDGIRPSETNESLVLIDRDDLPSPPTHVVDGYRQDIIQASTSSHGHGMVDGEENRVELLESAEKKNKFWKRPRRSSKTTVDSPEIDRSGSPTPRKSSSHNDTSVDLISARQSLDETQSLAQPRPQQLRRPSSSFFHNHNPFTRSVSRTSLALDIDGHNTKIDDGSFQLKGFRHVSGMMEIEGPGELESYVTHIKKEPNTRSPISSSDILTSPVSISDNDLPLPVPSPPVSHTSNHIPLSRPTSISHSLASVSAITDENLIPTNKVSLAAFRRGIRRPSEVFSSTAMTASDSGHYTSPHNPQLPLHHNDYDDDDTPLGMIVRREQSSQSLSSLRGNNPIMPRSGDAKPITMFNITERISSPALNESGTGLAMPSGEQQLIPGLIDRKDTTSPSIVEGKYIPTPSPNLSSNDITRRGSPNSGLGQDIPRKSSPNPGLSFTVQRQKQRHQRNGGGSGGFVVKSARLSRDDLIPKTTVGQVGETRPELNTPPVSDLSTPNPAEYISPQMVTCQEEFEPIDGYFSHLAPLIPDQYTHTISEPSNRSKPSTNVGVVRTASPAHAPGPPIESLSLPQPGEKTPGSLNLPLPPDQMPNTPPKRPSDLPSAANSTSPNAKKRLSLLEDPIRVISGLWGSPPPTEDAFDPDFVVSSMNVLGGDMSPIQSTQGREKTPPPALDDVAIGSLDVGEKIRSPLAERLAGIAQSTSIVNLSKTSLTKLRIEDDYATEIIKSPMSDPTSSPTNKAAPIPANKENFASSFARAKRPSESQAKLQEMESDESEGETVESSSTAPQARIGSKIRAETSGRKVPHGPRKPSIVNRKRITSIQSTASASSQSHPSSDLKRTQGEGDDEPLGTLPKKPSQSPLATKTNGYPSSQIRALQRSESYNKTSRVNGMSTSPGTQRPKTLIEIGPTTQPLRDRSSDSNSNNRSSSYETRRSTTSSLHSRAQTHQRQPSRPPSVDRTKSTTPSVQSRSPARTLIKLPNERESGPMRKSASPDSSRSVTTGGSSGNYQPLTPRDNSEAIRRLNNINEIPINNRQKHTKEDPIQGLQHSDRQRSHSAIGQSQNQSQPPWNNGYDQHHFGMGMGMMPPQMNMGMGMGGMDPEAIRNMMKQQWQMQFMAAAYRASEEEWEKASAVSGQTNHTLPASFGQGQTQQIQPMWGNMNVNMGMGMGQQFPNSSSIMNGGSMGYGYPQGGFPPYGYPIPPQTSVGGGGGGMYSYGVGAQSVFGGEFGPPSQRFIPHVPPMPSDPQQMVNPNPARINHSRGRRSSATRSVYTPSNLGTATGDGQNSPPPPSSWGKRNSIGSGDWSNLPQNQNQDQNQAQSQQGAGRKGRPQSQFIN